METREAPKQNMFFVGQAYDAFRLLAPLVQRAGKSIALVDAEAVASIWLGATASAGVTLKLRQSSDKAPTKLRQSSDVIPVPAHKTDWDQWRKTRAIQAARHLWKGL